MHLGAGAPWLQQSSGPRTCLDYGMCAHLARCKPLPSVNHSVINLVAGFVDVEMLERGATDHHVSRRVEIDQLHAVGRSCREEAELFDSGTKDTFLPGIRVEIPVDNFDVFGREFALQVL